MSKKSTARKSTKSTTKPGARAKALKVTPEVLARRAYQKARRERLKADAGKVARKPKSKVAVKAKATKSKPVKAPAVARAAAVAAVAMTLSKADLVGAIKGAIVNADDINQRIGLELALSLAEKLDD